MSTESSAPAITLGQCVRRKHDPLKALGFVLAIVFREPRELLVRWKRWDRELRARRGRRPCIVGPCNA
jgi:hypothetical protein